jgi:hypothetical protein
MAGESSCQTESLRGGLIADHEEDAMVEQTKTTDSPKLSTEMKEMEYEPLLPVEKKLISWSLGLGVVLLIFLYWLSVVFFPSGH